MANTLAQLANEEWARGLSRPSGNPVGQWIQGVAGRSTPSGYFNAMADEARRYQDMPIEDMASEVASNLTGGIGGGLVGMFAGKGAKTANLAKLARAEELRAAGVPDEQIWKETGWTMGFPDKQPRFEIPDDASRLSAGALDYVSKNPQEIPKIGSVLRHQELYGAYPEAKDISLFTHKGSGAEYSRTGTGDRESIKLSTFDEPKSPALHELQHAIQQREGFARGGSPDQIASELVKEQRAYFTNEAGKLRKEAEKFWEKSDRGAAAADQYSALLSKANEYDSLGFVRPEVSGIRGDIYKRLAGEAEARLTQARMNMTPEQRLANYPVSQFDVPVEQQIVRYGDGQANALSSMAGQSDENIPKLISDMAEARRIYEAQRLAQMNQPPPNTLRNLAIQAGALGGGAGAGYYGTDYMMGDRQ